MESAFGELTIMTKEKFTEQQNGGEMVMMTIISSRMVRSMVMELLNTLMEMYIVGRSEITFNKGMER